MFDMQASLCPSRAEILRLDIKLVDCPGTLLEMRYEENGVRKAVFSKDDDIAVRKVLGRDESAPTFSAEIQHYLDLEKKFKLSVWGYGAFVRIRDLEHLSCEVESFNCTLRELKINVLQFLRSRCKSRVPYRRILRFNPRVKMETYLLSRAFVNDRQFQRAVEIACEKHRLDEPMPMLLGI